MKSPKNNFYRKLKLPDELRKAIRFYNDIKKKMLEDLDAQGYYRAKNKENK